MIWSSVCNNPTEGFEVMPDESLKARAGQGYWVLTLEELDEIKK